MNRKLGTALIVSLAVSLLALAGFTGCVAEGTGDDTVEYTNAGITVQDDGVLVTDLRTGDSGLYELVTVQTADGDEYTLSAGDGGGVSTKDVVCLVCACDDGSGQCFCVEVPCP